MTNANVCHYVRAFQHEFQSKNEMFVTTADGKRLYRSGDLGYLLPDGNLAFLHRRDSQVMILGKRVEPEGTRFVLSEIKKKLRRYLTSFMIPEYFVILDHIPLTPNGKPDVKSLPVILKEGVC